MTSTMTPAKTGGVRLWAVAAWLLIWQLGAMILGQRLLLPSPVEVAVCLAGLLGSSGFYLAVARSAGRIFLGFFLACTAAGVLAALSARYSAVRALLAPAVAAVKAVPVVSFIILALVWLPTPWLPVLISGLMGFPTVYLNLLAGIDQTEPALLEMARVFRAPPLARLRGIYLPQAFPWFRSACSLGLGLCWKAGVAAEVIALPAGTLGERLYMAKVHLETPELFAWTAAVVAASVLLERGLLKLLDGLAGKELRQ